MMMIGRLEELFATQQQVGAEPRLIHGRAQVAHLAVVAVQVHGAVHDGRRVQAVGVGAEAGLEHVPVWCLQLAFDGIYI